MNSMNRVGCVACGVLLGALGAMTLLASPVRPAAASAAVEFEDDEAQREREAARKALRKQLEDVKLAVEQAEQQGNVARVRELRREGERLLDRLEQIQRAEKVEAKDEEEGRDEEGEERERHLHRFHLEMARLETEIGLSRIARASHIAQIAANGDATAAYAVSLAGELLEDDAVDFLEDVLKSTDDEKVSRIVRFKLIELLAGHEEGREQAAEQLKKLITGK